MAAILAVDDSASIRQMVSFTLRSAGHEVIEAVDGEDAVDKLREHTVDVILTDQNMPRMDGLTLVRTLRAREDCRHLPILILTTESSDAMKELGREAGATGWLVKPFDPERLINVIDTVMSR
jgi:two-component system chemotaxis response regulator CheY